MEPKRKKMLSIAKVAKKLVHIYETDEIKNLVKQNCGMAGQSGL